jgi:predicted metal-binding protein
MSVHRLDDERALGAADTEQRHFLRICRTCPRYERLPPPGEKTRGLELVEAVRALAGTWALAGKFTILGVHCLNGCPAPCNVTLAASDKPGLRFHRLGPADAAFVMDLAMSYYGASNGEPSLPPLLRERLAAVLPALRTARPGGAVVRFENTTEEGAS